MDFRGHPGVNAFKNAAERYCALLESEPAEVAPWIRTVLAELSQVYAAAHGLPNVSLGDDTPALPSALDVANEEWHAVFALVQRALGPKEMHWAYFDPSEPSNANEQPVIHSLADDLADIYRDLKPGIRAWEGGDDACLETVVFEWRTVLFGIHWGLHAVSAMRALHALSFLGDENVGA